MSTTVEQISEKIKFLPEEFLDRIMEYVEALAEGKTDYVIPEWQQKEVRERIADYKNNAQSGIAVEEVFKEIEKEFE